MCFVIAYGTERLIGIFDDRRTFIRADRLYPITHIRDLIRIGYDHLYGAVCPEISKFIHHLLSSHKVH